MIQTSTPSKIGIAFMLPEPVIAPLTIDELFSQIRDRFQEQLQAHGVEVREKQEMTIG